MPRTNINYDTEKANFCKGILRMLTVWKSDQDALQIVKDNDERIEGWMDFKGHPIVTAAVAARLLIIQETGEFPQSSEVRNI